MLSELGMYSLHGLYVDHCSLLVKDVLSATGYITYFFHEHYETSLFDSSQLCLHSHKM